MKKIGNLYNLWEERVLVGSIVATVTILFLQVIMRKVFNNSLSWSEELARFIFVWQIWLGVSIGLRKKSHISVELVMNLFKGNGKKALQALVVILSILFCLTMAVLGWMVAANLLGKNTLSPAMQIPLWLVYLSLPFSFLVTMLRHIGEFLDMFRKTSSGELPGKGE